MHYMPARILRMLSKGICVSAIPFLMSCSLLNMVDNNDLPSGVLDPRATQTKEGALALYHNTVKEFSERFARSQWDVDRGDYGTFNIIRMSGHMTDELQYVLADNMGGRTAQERLQFSIRSISAGSSEDVKQLFAGANLVRQNALVAQDLIRDKFEIGDRDTLVAHMMALRAASIIFLADFFCSGLPLSVLVPDGDVHLVKGISTEEAYITATNILDSANKLAGASDRISSLVSVLMGRSYLALGHTNEAAESVKDVVTGFQYHVFVKPAVTSTTNASKMTPSAYAYEKIGDRKGLNGLPYLSGTDHRVNRPDIYDHTAPAILVSGIEARLIEAEALLENEDTQWLDVLNSLRGQCSQLKICVGEGQVLAPLSDPAEGLPLSDPDAKKARRLALFSERAYWLLLTGTRQGDLRRLVRNYKHKIEETYPTGMSEVGFGAYGTTVAWPVPEDEKLYNDKYSGCINYEA